MSRSDLRIPRLRLLPGDAAELVEARGVAVGAGVALHQVEPVHGHEEARVLGVLDAQELAGDAAQLELDQPAVDADPVLGVHQVVARRELGERVDGGAVGPARGAPPLLLARTEDLLLGDHGELLDRQREALGERRHAHLDAPGRRPAPGRLRLGRRPRLDPVLARAACAGARRARASLPRAPPASAARATARAPRPAARARARGCARAAARGAARRGRSCAARSAPPWAARPRRRGARAAPGGARGRRCSSASGASESSVRRRDQPPARRAPRRSSRAPRRRGGSGARARARGRRSRPACLPAG